MATWHDKRRKPLTCTASLTHPPPPKANNYWPFTGWWALILKDNERPLIIFHCQINFTYRSAINNNTAYFHTVRGDVYSKAHKSSDLYEVYLKSKCLEGETNPQCCRKVADLPVLNRISFLCPQLSLQDTIKAEGQTSTGSACDAGQEGKSTHCWLRLWGELRIKTASDRESGGINYCKTNLIFLCQKKSNVFLILKFELPKCEILFWYYINK